MAAKLTPIQVLGILAERMEKTATCYEAVNIPSGYATAIAELRRYAAMIRKAQEYLRGQGM